ncbi:hypothetical protein GCM10010326_76600 [Streptomyces xanthochromogenes]|uniref:Uncharacterized protein n=1 Tax=Streptomyces xanthochromogenes TaxID=67384 RepID=A0ABQ3B1V2_9ACTN|nr:hypothetical protein GCM10010326_76600 [Streptomyces xanthochromogenes]
MDLAEQFRRGGDGEEGQGLVDLVAYGHALIRLNGCRRGLRPDLWLDLLLGRVRDITKPAQNVPGVSSACQLLAQDVHLGAVVLRERLPERLLQLLHALLESDQMLVHARMLAATRGFQFYSREI